LFTPRQKCGGIWGLRIAWSDQQIRDRISERPFCPAGVETLKHEGILPPVCLYEAWIHEGHDRLARNSHLEGGEIVVLIERADQSSLGDRMVAAVRHILLARPDHLDGRVRHLHRNEDGLLHEVVGRAAAEPATKRELVHLAFRRRQTGGFAHGGKRRFTVLGGDPCFAAISGVERRRVHRLHRRVVLIREGVHRLNLSRGMRDLRPERCRSRFRR